MTSCAPMVAQQLEPFHIFCREGKKVTNLCVLKPSISITPERQRIQQACKTLYGALLRVLMKLESCEQLEKCLSPKEGLPPSLLALLEFSISEYKGNVASNPFSPSNSSHHSTKPSIPLDRLVVACTKASKTPGGDIDWLSDEEEVQMLERASRNFRKNLISSEELPQQLNTELEAYEKRLGQHGMYAEADVNEDTSTTSLPKSVRHSANTQSIIDSLFSALAVTTAAVCDCLPLSEPHRYELRLPLLAFQLPKRLRLQIRRQQDDWQHLRISLELAASHSSYGQGQNLCTQLSKASYNSQYLNFILQNSTLHVRELGSRPPGDPDFATEARSLEKIVEASPQLSKEMVRTVALKLAWSAIHLIGSNWLKRVWNDGSIWFIEKERNSISLHPYLQVYLPDDAEVHTCNESCFGCIKREPLHLFQLASLGIMLVELDTGLTASQYVKASRLATDNTTHVARHFFEYHRQAITDEGDFDYLSAIKACINPNFELENEVSVSIEDLRRQMLEQIVAPLYRSSQEHCISHKENEWTSYDENISLTDRGRPLEDEQHSLFAESKGAVFLKKSSGVSKSELWFSRLDETLAVMEKLDSEQKKLNRVKIAVLDTGITENYPYLEKDHFHDFVSPGQTCTDKTGHGTTSVNLILRVYPDAELFVARIFENNEVNEDDAPGRMTKAIKWAAEKDVDIISISAGFVERNDEIERAIKEAQAHYISKGENELLIFAAASNYANRHGKPAFPASLYDSVFAVFSCSGDSKQTDTSNPDPDDFNLDNFAMIGEEVHVFPGRILNGSSVSTALSAGVAARIIDFSRHRDVEEYLQEKGLRPIRVSQMKKMRTILRKISTKTGKFHCITPWNLWKHAARSQSYQNADRHLVRKLLKDSLQCKD